MKGEFIMKTNMIHTNSVIKSICAVVMLLGFSVNAWGYTVTIHQTLTGCSEHSGNATTFESDRNTTLSLYYDITSGYDDSYPSTLTFASGSTPLDLVSVSKCRWHDDDKDGVYQLDIYFGSNISISNSDFYITLTLDEDCIDPELIIDTDEKDGDYGTLTDFTINVLSESSGTITWSSTNTDVATVSGDGEEATVTIVGVGEADIVCSQAANGGYCAGEETCTLAVYAVAPTLSHNASGKELTVSGITSTGATFTGGVVTDKGGADITRYGFTIGTSATVVINGTGANAPVASGFWDDDITLNTAFGSKTSVSNFSPNTTYYVRAFAYNGSVYGYSTAVQFKTLKQFTITLDGNGVSNGIAAVEENAAELIEITAPTRDHYTLEGYYTTSECDTKIANTTGELVASITVGGNNWTDGDGKWIRNTDETFYANWTPDNQTISFNNNGGSGSMDNVVRAYNTTYNLPACTFTAPDGKVFDGWAEGSAEGTVRAVGYSHTVTGNITFYAKWRDGSYTDAKFSCADWTLTGPSGDIVFITSAANKTVRSQEAFHVSGNGLPHSTALTFTTFPVNTKFEFKKADGTIPQTNEFGVVDADVYAFYTPDAGDTSDGLDELTSLTVSVTGEPRTATIDTKRVIGRHLPADFVIAVKYTDNQWYALPADLGSASNPSPVAIRVNNESNPTIAYCANTNSYTLYQDNVSNSQKVILGTTNNKNGSGVSYALWGSAGDNTLGINTSVVVTGNPGDQYKWTLTQTASSISTIADAKYNIRVSGNSNDLKLWTNAGLTKWGSYASGVKELRLLTLSEVAPMTMKVMEWGTNAIVVSYPNGGSATSPQVRIGDGDAANVTLTSLGGDIYKITTISGLQDNPAKTLTITATESGTGKQALFPIPLIVTTTKTVAELRTAAGSNDIAKLTDVIIRDGGRMTTGTASGNFNDIYIYPGGKAKITKNFIANNIYMRGGYSFLDEKATFKYPDLCVEDDGLSTTTIDLPAANKLYYDFYIDNRKYYMFSMPQDVTLVSVTDEAGYDDFPVWVKHYDGNLRASGHGVSGWTWYGDEVGQESFFAGIGYEITAQPKTSGRPIAIIRFPVITGDITTDAGNSPGVTVTYYGKSAYETGTQTANNVGWNFIGNPYLTEYKAVSDTSMIVKSDFVQHKENGQWDGTYEWKETSARFITVPCDMYNDYRHELVKGYTIPAFSTFFFQFAEDATGTFHMGGTRPQAALAPARFGATPKATPEISLDIMLHGIGEAEEGKAGLIIHETYDGGLKDFEDVEQWFVGNNIQKTYTFASGTALAYNLLNEEAINELIPMGYIATVGGEHVYALNEENDVSALEHLWLIDYTTGVTTDLLVRNYSFVTAAGRFDSRFAINAELKQEEVPTDISNTPGGDWATTIGVYSDENMLTLRGLPDNSAVYIFDMNGRLLQSSEKLSNIASFSIATQGVYNIRVIAEGKAITLRTVLR